MKTLILLCALLGSANLWADTEVLCQGTSLTHDISVKIQPTINTHNVSPFEFRFSDVEGQYRDIKFTAYGKPLQEGRGYYTIESGKIPMHSVKLAVDGERGYLWYSMRGEPEEAVVLKCEAVE